MNVLNGTTGPFIFGGLMGLSILIGVILRRTVPFFRKLLVPASVLGGIVGLIIVTFCINGGVFQATIQDDFTNIAWHFLSLIYIGMKATTAPKGRNAKEHGYPMHMCEILNQLEAPYYLERTSCNTPANVNKTKNAIKKAFQNQLEGKGFSLVEVVTGCPTNWGLDALGSLKFIEEKMLPEYPLGGYRDRSKEA